MRVQLMPLRLSRVLRKTLSSSTWAFSGLRMTASNSACCLAAAAICGAQLGDLFAHVGELHVIGVGQRDESGERGDQQHGDGGRGHEHGAIAAEGLAGEIDGDLHFKLFLAMDRR